VKAIFFFINMDKLGYKFDWDWWDWRFTAAILCGVGLLKEYQPSEPFISNYII
jgi:hypothetical protein